MNLSKSQYIRGLQCVKSLWLYKHKRDEAVTPPDAAAQAVFDTGTRVGELACELFPGGERITYENTSFREKIDRTRALISQGCETIYEATFEYDGVLVMVDILHKGPKGWEIYEVKSASNFKEHKETYEHDASVQYYVLNGCGLKIAAVNIIHINNKYVRGKALEIDTLFSIVDVTEEVRSLQVNIPANLSHFNALVSDKDREPAIDIGLQCFNPYDCDCTGYCWKSVPEYSVFDLSRIRKNKAFALFESGIVALDDIDDISAFTPAQQIQITSERQNRTIIDREAIDHFLSQLTYPVYHLDFETFQQAIPEYEGISPYQQIPFQYSLHIEQKDGTLEHREFLAKEGTDPRRALAEKLLRDIPTDATVLAYNKSFEQRVIRELAAAFPDLADKLLVIHDNILDLMTPFQKKHYYTPAMKGSYSIKYVLPALVPEMERAYKNLEGIHNGGEAMNAYASLHLVEDEEERREIRKALLAYCKLDTLAMVEVLKKLK